jgi:hypothetical protein
VEKIIVGLFLATIAIGCNSGTWVDGGAILSAGLCGPDKDKLASRPDTAEGIKVWARAACGKAGKAFTGDTRCENGSGQVKCK